MHPCNKYTEIPPEVNIISEYQGRSVEHLPTIRVPQVFRPGITATRVEHHPTIGVPQVFRPGITQI